MKELNKIELNNISGGFKWIIGGVIGGVLAFIVGVLDGFTRPLKCNS